MENFKVLVVEDDEDKRQQLTNFVEENLTKTPITAKSLQSGIRALEDGPFDLIILDMSMTTFDITANQAGGRPQPYGGKELLNQMVRKKLNSKVVVVTQFTFFGSSGEEISLKELDGQLFNSFPGLYIGAIHYSVTYAGWQEKLIDLLQANGIKNV